MTGLNRLAIAVAACSMLAPAAVAQHNTDPWVGRIGGQLALSPSGLIPGTVYNPLFPVDTFLHGWSNNDPGFDRVTTPAGGVSPLLNGAEIYLDVLSVEAAFVGIDNSFAILELPGDSTFLGDENLHEHITWFIDRDDPRFDPKQCVWEATFKLADEGTGLIDSLPFTFLFTNHPVRGGEFPFLPLPASGDFDGDSDVDVDDARTLAECVHGPDRRPAPDDPDITTCEVDCHNAFDFDDDMDVDLLDVAEFQVVFDP